VTPLEIALTACNVALWLPGTFCLWRLPRCPPAPSERDGLQVSVIIPARNEQRRIAPLLESLGRQIRPAQEILVVDDGSIDGTAGVARDLGAAVITAPPKPDGWTGKTWACWTGSREAHGELLVFLDADTVLEPDGL
jgi:4,4'-diaponeurosporenoate glycosyltransferase